MKTNQPKLPHKKKSFQWVHFAPKRGVKRVAIVCDGQWTELCGGQTILAHESRTKSLQAYGLRPVKCVKIYSSQKAAIQAKNNYQFVPTE